MDVLREIGEAFGAAGLGAVAKALWDRYRERKNQEAVRDTTKITTKADYDKRLLEIATTMTEQLMKDLREEVAMLRQEVKEKDKVIAELREEIAHLRAEVEEHS